MTLPVFGVVLAAGKGTRMKSDKAKVLHEVFFAPMVHHVLDAIKPLDLAETFVVVGHQREAVKNSLHNYNVCCVEQKSQLGTGHAVLVAEKQFDGKQGTVLILCGDTPLVRTETLRQMLDDHAQQGAVLTVMTTMVDDPTHYGRIITDEKGNIERIVEEKDASPAQKGVREINAGMYCVASDFLFRLLKKVGSDNEQGEVYLTDVVALARQEGQKVNRFVCPEAQEILGVNSRVELAQAHAALQNRYNQQLMNDGVTLIHPETISIEKTVSIGRDTVIEPHVVLRGKTAIGENCCIESFVKLIDCQIGAGTKIGSFSCLEGSRVAADETLACGTMRSGNSSAGQAIC